MNQRDRSWTDDRLERELRRVLTGRARAAPLPAELPGIPAGWVRAPSSSMRIGIIAKAAGVVAIAFAFAILVSQLYRFAESAQAPRIPRVTTAAAASLLSVPAGQVIETRDGAVAVRLIDDEGLKAEIHLIKGTESGLRDELLSVAPIPLGVLEDGSHLMWYERLSCVPERGLSQPNLFFGATSPSEGIVVSEPARTTWEDRLFITVLEDEDLTGIEVDIASEPALFDEGVGVNFDRADPCTGEPPRSTLPDRLGRLPALAECLRRQGIQAQMQADGGLSYNYGTPERQPLFDAAMDACELEIGPAP